MDILNAIQHLKGNVNENLPAHFQGLVDNPEELINWNTIEHVINDEQRHPHIDIAGDKTLPPATPILAFNRDWSYDGIVHPLSILDHLSKGYTIALGHTGRFSKRFLEVRRKIDQYFQCHSDAHVYFSTTDRSCSFDFHCDRPGNFVLQVTGSSHVIVIDKYGDEPTAYPAVDRNSAPVLLDVIMNPGDVVFLPSMMMHKFTPQTARISISYPLWRESMDKQTPDYYWYELGVNHGN